MTHPALPLIESGLAGAQAALLAGDFETLRARLQMTLDALARVTAEGLVPRQQRPAAPWDGPRALRLVWRVLAELRTAGCPAFPYAGTLLGLQRDGALLPNDKDADIAVWLEDFSLAGRLLQGLGLRRARDVPPFGNVATFIDGETGYSVDVFGLRRDAARGCIDGGAWLYDRPPSHQRVLRLPVFALREKPSPAGLIWWPDPAEALLEAFYGDWRTPQPEWDTQISNRALVAVNLSWTCLAWKALCQCWLTGDLPRTQRLAQQIRARGGAQPQLDAWCAVLDAAVTSASPRGAAP